MPVISGCSLSPSPCSSVAENPSPRVPASVHRQGGSCSFSARGGSEGKFSRTLSQRKGSSPFCWYDRTPAGPFPHGWGHWASEAPNKSDPVSFLRCLLVAGEHSRVLLLASCSHEVRAPGAGLRNCLLEQPRGDHVLSCPLQLRVPPGTEFVGQVHDGPRSWWGKWTPGLVG